MCLSPKQPICRSLTGSLFLRLVDQLLGAFQRLTLLWCQSIAVNPHGWWYYPLLSLRLPLRLLP